MLSAGGCRVCCGERPCWLRRSRSGSRNQCPEGGCGSCGQRVGFRDGTVIWRGVDRACLGGLGVGGRCLSRGMSSAADHHQEVPVPGSPDEVLAAARAASSRSRLPGWRSWSRRWSGRRLHEPTGTGDAAYWWEAGHMVPLAGEGAPEIAEYAIAEFATALGVLDGVGASVDRARPRDRLSAAGAVEARLQAGRVPAWRATRVAEATMALSQAAAGFVDRQVAAVAGRVSLTQLDHLVLEARTGWRAWSGRTRRTRPRRCPTPGTWRCTPTRCRSPAPSRSPASSTWPMPCSWTRHWRPGAEQLKLAGSAESLDARRATALGEMSRTQLALSFDQEADGGGAARRCAGGGR